jgi:hypothetical protein
MSLEQIRSHLEPSQGLNRERRGSEMGQQASMSVSAMNTAMADLNTEVAVLLAVWQRWSDREFGRSVRTLRPMRRLSRSQRDLCQRNAVRNAAKPRRTTPCPIASVWLAARSLKIASPRYCRPVDRPPSVGRHNRRRTGRARSGAFAAAALMIASPGNPDGATCFEIEIGRSSR